MPTKRTGSSYLEIQVAMVLLAIGISGLYSLSVIQTRQTAKLSALLPADEVASINPVQLADSREAGWAKKLGVYGTIESDSVTAPTVKYPLNEGFEVIVDNEYEDSFTVYRASGSKEWKEHGGWSGDYESNVARLDTDEAYGSYCMFTVTDIPPGDYEVLLFLPRDHSLGTAVPHYLLDGATLIDTLWVDQQTEVEDHEHAGRWWQRLGVYTLHNGTLRVVISDTPVSGDRIAADAIMVRCRRSFDVITAVQRTDQGGAEVTVELN